MIAAARAVLFAAALLATCASVAQSGAAPKLEGVWGATRDFGPKVRGTLELTRSGETWRARIAGFEVEAEVRGKRIAFTLPDGAGSFDGTLEPNDVTIRGSWVQPPTVNSGTPYATPVALRRSAPGNAWRGEVVPLEDGFTFYLVFSTRPDGSTAAFLRNPDRNQGLWWRIERVEQSGDHVKLVGKFRGRGEERVFGEGTYRAEEKVLSLYFPGRGGSYDFTPITPSSSFHARAPGMSFRYSQPVQANDGWKTATLTEVGMDLAPIAELIRVATPDPKDVEELDLHALLIARHGKLVLEEYFHGNHRLMPHETRSAGKVVASILVGAAMQRGVKLDTSTRVYDVLMPGADVDPLKKQMTVEHLLTMASGYDCDDWAGDRPGSEDHILDDEPDKNYYRYTLQLPMEMPPGKEAVYCSINPNLVGAVVAAAAKRPLTEIFDEWVARPMQLGTYYLNLQPTGEVYLGGGARFLPRDFMKLGQMTLDGGMWNGTRVLPREYATRLGKPHTTLRKQPPSMHYGYLWWTIDYPYKDRTTTAYWASGNGGQAVIVFPEFDMVVASFGGNYGGSAGWKIVKDYIPKYVLPALVDASR